MNKLNEIANLGFKVTWKVIAIGLYGESYITPQLLKEDVFEFLDELLTIETYETNNIIKLICEKENDYEVKKIIHIFAEMEKSDIALQLRKWRAYLLKKALDNISRDYLQGLLELTEFWVSVGVPLDGPHIYPSLSQEYFTQKIYESLKEKNEDWLLKEIKDIIFLEI